MNSRPDIDMEKAVGTYVFSSVARSLFAADGMMVPCADKYKLMTELEILGEDDTVEKL